MGKKGGKKAKKGKKKESEELKEEMSEVDKEYFQIIINDLQDQVAKWVMSEKNIFELERVWINLVADALNIKNAVLVWIANLRSMPAD